MEKILIVDDDEVLCELLADYLTKEGFQVDVAHDGQSGAEKIEQKGFDLLVLDIMLPKLNGLELLKETRQQQNTPILMLTAKGDEVDRIIGLELGADDYLAKPCNPRELTARIRSILRRIQMARLPSDEADNQQQLRIGDLCLDPQRRSVSTHDTAIDLTATEYDILKRLLEEAGQLVTRETISETCLGRKLMSFDRSIDMHISHLRKKLGPDETGKERIKTIRGVGYQYVAL